MDLVAGGALIVINNASDGLAAVLICAGVIAGLSFAVIAFAMVAALASALPTLAALRVDPMETLRQE